MDRLRAGDEAAFEQIYRRHGQRVFAYLWRRLNGDEALAADLRQEVFVRLWRLRHPWDESGSLLSFLITVARRLAIDAHRRREVRERKQPLVAEHLGAPPLQPDVDLDRRELEARVQHAIAELPPRTAQVFSLKRDAGMSYREISDLLGIAPKTVEVHVGRALRALRQALADLRPTDDG